MLDAWSANARPVPSRRGAGDSNERSRKVRMVGETGAVGDGGDRLFAAGKLSACPRDAPPSDVLAHRIAESPPEKFGEMHRMNAGDARDIGESVDLHQVRVEIIDTAVEALVRFEEPVRTGALSCFAQQRDRFLDRERSGCIRLLKLAPHAQGVPLDVAAEDAANKRVAGAVTIGKLVLDVERKSAGGTDLVRVRFAIVKDHRSAFTPPRLASRAFDITAAQHVREKPCCMCVLGEAGSAIVRRLVCMQTGAGEGPSDVPGCGSLFRWMIDEAIVLRRGHFTLTTTLPFERPVSM
jgi:hypothetical protein